MTPSVTMPKLSASVKDDVRRLVQLTLAESDLLTYSIRPRDAGVCEIRLVVRDRKEAAEPAAADNKSLSGKARRQRERRRRHGKAAAAAAADRPPVDASSTKPPKPPAAAAPAAAAPSTARDPGGLSATGVLQAGDPAGPAAQPPTTHQRRRLPISTHHCS